MGVSDLVSSPEPVHSPTGSSAAVSNHSALPAALSGTRGMTPPFLATGRHLGASRANLTYVSQFLLR